MKEAMMVEAIRSIKLNQTPKAGGFQTAAPQAVASPDAVARFEAVMKAVGDAGIQTVSAEVTMIPQNYVSVTDEAAVKGLQRILDMLDDDDDVQAVYHNWDEPDAD